MYKIIHGLVDLNIHNYLHLSKETRTRNSRAYKFQMPFSSKNALKFSFFPIKDLKGVESASSNLVFRAFPLKKKGGAPPFFELPADRGSVVSIAPRVQGESDYFYELQSKLA